MVTAPGVVGVVRLAAAPEPDGRLDPYRRGAASVFDGDVLVGHLVTRVQVWWTVVGQLWRRRGVDPVEKVEWLLAVAPGESHRFGGRDYVDDVQHDTDALIEELSADRFDLWGRAYRLEWSRGVDAVAAWDQYGWD